MKDFIVYQLELIDINRFRKLKFFVFFKKDFKII